MYKNNTVNIQNGTPDTEYIDEFLSIFFSPGGWRGASPGSVHSSYIHGHAWLSDWGVSMGAEGRGCSWDPPFWGPLPCPAEGPRAWAGDTRPWQGRQITPPWVLPHLEEIMEGVTATGPLPPHPLLTVWDGGRGSQ